MFWSTVGGLKQGFLPVDATQGKDMLTRSLPAGNAWKISFSGTIFKISDLTVFFFYHGKEFSLLEVILLK